MKAEFVGQARGSTASLISFLDKVVADQGLTSLVVVVAWAKDSGLARVHRQVSDVGSRGSTELIVGVDSHGATEEGLRSARDLFDTVSVFHDPSGGTFHPKIYAAVGSDRALVFVGSNNLTAGGLFYNYEAAICLELELTDPVDHRVLSEIEDYFDRLRGDSDLCKDLSQDVLDAILAAPRFGITSESEQHTVDDLQDSYDAMPPQPVESIPLFGKSQYSPAADPGRNRGTPAGQPDRRTNEVPDRSPRDPTSGSLPQRKSYIAGAVVKRWTKKLTGSDAQQKATEATQITGNLKLTQARHPIDHLRYFRHDFFGQLSWIAESKPRGVLETAEVDMEVLVDGIRIGTFVMIVDHADYRVAGQGNVATWLKWRAFGDYLRNNDQRGRFASLEVLDGGQYRLHLADEPSGDFVV